MTSTRRDFLKTASVAAAGGLLLGRDALAEQIAPRRAIATVGDPVFRDVAMWAIDAARSAGAEYADVRVTFLKSHGAGGARRGLSPAGGGAGRYIEQHDVGIRVLINGIWGFAHETDFNKDIVTRAAQIAVKQAKANSMHQTWRVELAETPVISNGQWETPVKIDPFLVDIDEVANLGVAAADEAFRVKGIGMASAGISFSREERVFASTTGSLISQGFTIVGGGGMVAGSSPDEKEGDMWSMPPFSHMATGYEAVLALDLQTALIGLAEEMMRTIQEPKKSIEPGQYELVVDGQNLANPIRDTLAVPLEMDRVLGMEANAEGTSFMAPPKEKLGTKKPIISSLISVRGHREPPGPAACGYDDDGVAPEAFTMIQDGHVVDYATDRQTATAIDWWYKQNGKSVKSHGCAVAQSGGLIPLVGLPNLEVAPGAQEVSIEDMVKDVKKGILVRGPSYSGGSDQQGVSGQYSGRTVQEIRNGKILGYRKDVAYRFLTVPFWKGMQAIGGKSTLVMSDLARYKGEPYQRVRHGILCPAGRFKDVYVENTGREL